jgi:hypothetical protein
VRIIEIEEKILILSDYYTGARRVRESTPSYYRVGERERADEERKGLAPPPLAAALNISFLPH